MTIPAFQVNEVTKLYARVAKLKPSTILNRDQEERQDIVEISADARKRQILTQAKHEVLERIKSAR